MTDTTDADTIEPRNEIPTTGCIVCGPGSPTRAHSVPEAMFRSGESFPYRECLYCGTLHLDEMPADMSHYYSSEYYSFEPPNAKWTSSLVQNRVARTLIAANTAIYLETGVGIGIEWARRADIRVGDRILDLGCGGGTLIHKMHTLGFRAVSGADPFIDDDHEVAPGVVVRKVGHSNLSGEFDCVMLHHTFEHVPDPAAVLRSARRLLTPRGKIVIRLPLTGGWAWRHYGSDWVQLDAPRHLLLFTLPSLRRFAEMNGFRVTDVVFDSHEFQMRGSELVRQGKAHSKETGDFSASQRQAWARHATELNQAQDGDQAMVVLRTGHEPGR